ncbi:MAG: response regulator [candidate division Zixibacteria bacterium]|nr:response regulator [candidate division Zixibacteria bacterium]
MKKSILAVDVEPHMVRLLEKIIKDKTSHQIKSTHNALELPEILNKESFDIIITEMNMPGFNGLDLLQRIDNEGRKEAVIVLTADDSVEKTIEAFRWGACDVIVKPFKTSQLFDAIDKAIVCGEKKGMARCLRDMMQVEPFDEACEQFRQKYIHSLLKSTGGDIGKVADKMNMSRGAVETSLRKNKE